MGDVVQFLKRVPGNTFVVYDEVEDKAIEISTKELADIVFGRKEISDCDPAKIRATLLHLLEFAVND